MSIGLPIPEKKLFQTLKFQIQGQGHGCGQRARSYNRPSIILTHLVSISHQAGQQFLRQSYFETIKVKVMSEVKGQGHILYPVSNRCTSFLFHINRTNRSRDMTKTSVWPWIIPLWVKVTKRSSNTLPQTHIFFVPNILSLAQMVLTWESKVVAVADAAAAETNWKHKVIPHWGDLIISIMSFWLIDRLEYLEQTLWLHNNILVLWCFGHLDIQISDIKMSMVCANNWDHYCMKVMFVYTLFSLSSLCGLIWKHWMYEILVKNILPCVCLRWSLFS